MDRNEAEVRQIRDAALVRAVRRDIDEAIAVLAARPLDEAAALRMRHAIGERSASARAALRRLNEPVTDPGPLRPRLVTSEPGGRSGSGRDAPPRPRAARRPSEAETGDVA